MDRRNFLLNALLSSAGGGGGGGDEYEEILLYENPAPDNSMAAGSMLVDFTQRDDDITDYDYFKITLWYGTAAESFRYVIVPGLKLTGNVSSSYSANRAISNVQYCRIISFDPETGGTSGTNSIRAWAVFYPDGRYTDTNLAVPWRIHGIKKK